MASSCSALKQLSLCCSPGLQLTALLQLTGLSQLWLKGDITSSTMASLAQLSGLQGLHTLVITSYSSIEGSKLFQLTKLTQLTYLALPYKSVFSTAVQQQLQRFYHCGASFDSFDSPWLWSSSYIIRSKVRKNSVITTHMHVSHRVDMALLLGLVPTYCFHQAVMSIWMFGNCAFVASATTSSTYKLLDCFRARRGVLCQCSGQVFMYCMCVGLSCCGGQGSDQPSWYVC